MFPVQITLNNPTELAKVLAALGFNAQPQAELPLTLVDPTPAEPKAEAKKPKATPAPQPAAPAPSQPTAEAAVADAPAKSTAAPAPQPSTAPAAAASSASEVDYPTLQKAVFALAGKSREAAAAVAASFGVKTFKELDASKWGDALAAVNAKIAEV